MTNIDNQSVRVVGLARNVDSTIKSEFARVDAILKQIFSSIEYFIVESDSVDRTSSVLSELKYENRNFDFIALGKLEEKLPLRIERLSYCRNIYVRWLRETPASSRVLVLDWDTRNTHLNSRSIRSALEELPNASGIFANQAGRYFDIYALRSHGWVDGDCLHEYWDLRKTLGAKKAKQKAIWSKMRKISPNHPILEVDSAFGGLGIYQSWVFIDCDYSKLSTNSSNESEHVFLHHQIRSKNGRLFIHPKLINFAWNPHNLSSFRIIRVFDRVSRIRGVRGLRRALRNQIR